MLGARQDYHSQRMHDHSILPGRDKMPAVTHLEFQSPEQLGGAPGPELLVGCLFIPRWERREGRKEVSCGPQARLGGSGAKHNGWHLQLAPLPLGEQSRAEQGRLTEAAGQTWQSLA